MGSSSLSLLLKGNKPPSNPLTVSESLTSLHCCYLLVPSLPPNNPFKALQARKPKLGRSRKPPLSSSLLKFRFPTSPFSATMIMMRGFSFFFANLQNLVYCLLPLLDKIPPNLLPMSIDKLVALASRSGRQFQRYDSRGFRLVVGCIPYRYRERVELNSVDAKPVKDLEVLVISAQKGSAMLFPKGGWEENESMEEAASRETLEEAGVIGKVEGMLGQWQYKSKSGDIVHEGYMFPLLVNQQLELWPEKNIRRRRWVTVAEAKEMCPHAWMREALEVLVQRQTQKQAN